MSVVSCLIKNHHVFLGEEDMKIHQTYIKKFRNIHFGSCAGQGLTEYAIVLSLVAIASIASMGFFGGAIKGKIASLSGAIAGQSASEVSASDKKAQKSAKEAAKRASSVKGNTSITENDLFDGQSL